MNPVNAETISNINSWEDCAARCRAKASCKFWDWRNSKAETPNTCVLNEGFDKSKDNWFATAGSRDCQGMESDMVLMMSSLQAWEAG